MKLGSYLLPQWRLEEQIMPVLKKIYASMKLEPIQSKDLASLLGYKYGTEPTLFKTINSMLAYGVLEGSGVYNITKFGENLIFPESTENEKKLKTTAFFNVPLWRKLYEKNGKNIPKDGLWVQLKNIAEIDPATAKKFEPRIFGWYVDDLNLVHDEYVEKQDLSSEEEKFSDSKYGDPHKKKIVPQIETPHITSLGKLIVPAIGTLEINDADTISIARSYLDLLEKKIKEKTDSHETSDQE